MAKKENTFDNTIEELRKKYGSNSIIQVDSAPLMTDVDSISTGSFLVDQAIGIGGVPRGRITEIFGPESSGKTTLCQHIVAEAQKKGLRAAYIDVEHALDLDYLRRTGVNTKDLWLSQPDSAEQAGSILEGLVRTNDVGVVIVDSIAALVPIREIEADTGEIPIGAQARFMSHLCRKLAGAIKTSNTAVVFTNQIRHKIGVMFGSPETTPGGFAVKYYASVRMDIRKRALIKDNDTVVGNEARIKVVKNKVGPPFREATITIGNSGIQLSAELFELAVQHKVVTTSGSHIYYDGERIAQGKKQFVDYLDNNPEFMAKLMKMIRESVPVASPIALNTEDEIEEEYA